MKRTEELNKKMENRDYEAGIRWGIYHGMWVFGGKTPAEFLDNVKKFDNTLSWIRLSVVLVMDGVSGVWGGRAKQLYNALTCEAYMLFTKRFNFRTLPGWCRRIATQRMFDWMDENLQ